MKIELHKIPVCDVFEGYVNNQEDGVVGYGGKLDIRPRPIREILYINTCTARRSCTNGYEKFSTEYNVLD